MRGATGLRPTSAARNSTTNRCQAPTAWAPPARQVRRLRGDPKRPATSEVETRIAAGGAAGVAAGAPVARIGTAPRRTAARGRPARSPVVAAGVPGATKPIVGGRTAADPRGLRGAGGATSRPWLAVATKTTRDWSSWGSRKPVTNRRVASRGPAARTIRTRLGWMRCATCRAGSRRSASSSRATSMPGADPVAATAAAAAIAEPGVTAT
jgi:hypothetical protein